MGKKGKIGKSRKDKFYHLAKETGFRARSAFKLLQLNRKYEFLQKSRVCIDLCAAPGGWLQVAAQNMPVASIIMGVDLVPIKPIHNVKTFTEDITTEKCRQVLKKELHDWKADVVLNDGAPNVGKNWVHDAFAQAELTLSALKLATEFLRKGGWFVTKVFRSKDYQSLVWVFSQLFKKVFATKPQASRNESAEIFVVCQGFLAPDKLDPKFTDPKYVFKEVLGGEKKKDILNTKDKKVKPHGYGDDDTVLHYTLNASKLIAEENHMELLANCHQVVLDEEDIANHKLTTDELKDYMSDIKVLGKREIKMILKWRLKMKKFLKPETPETENSEILEEREESEDEDAKIDETVAALREEEEKDAKKKRKQVMKEKRKLRDKMNLKMVIPGDEPLQTDETELFNIKKMKKKKELDVLEAEPMLEVDPAEEEEEMERLPNKIAFDRHADITDPGIFTDEEEEDEKEEEDEEDDEDAEEGDGGDGEEAAAEPSNPLVVDLEERDLAARRKAAMWFDKEAFSSLEAEVDQDLELEAAEEEYKRKGGRVVAAKRKQVHPDEDVSEDESDDEEEEEDDDDEEEETPQRKRQKTEKSNAKKDTQSNEEEGGEESEGDSDSSDSDSDEDDDIYRAMKHRLSSAGAVNGAKAKNNAKKDGFEVVPISQPGVSKVVKLSPVELAIGEELIKSSKRRREIVEGSFNRYSGHDENVPEWFLKDEQRHLNKQLPVTKEQIDEYKARLTVINARPIKKVAEAKARKKRKSVKKLEKVRKKAEAITETQDVSDKEKWQQIRQIYSRAGLLKKKKESIAYVVAKRGTGKKVSRPAGIKGKFRVVDPRMKKDDKQRKMLEKSSRGKKGKSGRAAAGRGRKR